MTDELRGQEFFRDDWSYANSARKEAEAVRRESRFPCGRLAVVYWRADGQGRLTSIRGEFLEGGCL